MDEINMLSAMKFQKENGAIGCFHIGIINAGDTSLETLISSLSVTRRIVNVNASHINSLCE